LATYRRRRFEQLAWDREHPEPADPAEFTERIRPTLRGVSVTELQKATGLSKRDSSLIRRGLYTPHPRWWDALQIETPLHRPNPHTTPSLTVARRSFPVVPNS